MEKQSQKKVKKKGIPLIAVIIMLIVIIIIGVIVIKNVNKPQKDSEPQLQNDDTMLNPYAKNAKTANDIKINSSDGTSVKVEKMQGKLEIMNKDIKTKQEEIEKETEKLNKLYEQYLALMNE